MPTVEPESLAQQRQRASALSQWLQQADAIALREAESAAIADILRSLTGHIGVQLGCWFERLPWCAVPSWYSLDVVEFEIARPTQVTPARPAVAGRDVGAVNTCTTFEMLPLAKEKLSVVLLAHVLERSSRPFCVLQEAARALEDGGAMLVLGSNSQPFWRRLPWQQRQRLPWQRQLLSQQRVQRWLHDLGLSIEMVLTVDSPERASCPGSYVVLARKHVPPLTPQLRFRSRKPIMQPAAVAVGRIGVQSRQVDASPNPCLRQSKS